MSRRPRNPAPPGRPGPVRKDRVTPAGQRPAVWPDVVDTVMLAKFTRQTDALLPGPRPAVGEPRRPVRDPVRAGGPDPPDGQHGVRGRGPVPLQRPSADRPPA